MHSVNAGLTVLVPLQEDRVETARALLTELHQQQELLPFARSTTTHFATITIIPAQTYRGEPLPALLLFATSFAGPVRVHVAELAQVMGDGLRGIFAHCERFDPACSDDALARFLLANRHGDTFYSGMRYLSPLDVRRNRELHEAIDKYLDDHRPSGTSLEVRRAIQDHIRAIPAFEWTTERAGPTLGARLVFYRRSLLVEGVLLALIVSTIAACLGDSSLLCWVVGVAWLVVVAFVVFLVGMLVSIREAEDDQQYIAVRPDNERARALAATQNRPVINEFTLGGPIKEEGDFRPLFLRISLWIIGRIADGLPGVPSYGTGINIPTVATARWIACDGGRRLLFISNYTNGGEGYVRDFIETTGGAKRINLSFGFGHGFPKTRWIVNGGALDDPNAYLHALAENTLTTLFWYGPYHDRSIDNIKVDRLIREGLFAKFDERQARNWLDLLPPSSRPETPQAPVASSDPDELLELRDIQGLVLRAYGKLDAHFLLLTVDDVDRARAYLRGLAGRLNTAYDSSPADALQIAFTRPGLAALGVPDSALRTFSREFYEGMDDEVRAAILGDHHDNDRSKWSWGRHDEPVHALLMLYAPADQLAVRVADERRAFAGGFVVAHDKPSAPVVDDRKEHFGWADGLSMPKLTGVPSDRPRPDVAPTKPKVAWTQPIPAGEFVLGYRNDYRAYTDTPTIDLADDPARLLPRTPDRARGDLGRNGSYLVYRELAQDVPGFWRYLAGQSSDPLTEVASATVLGAKMVGRWPSGAPLATAPDGDDEGRKDDNEFRFDSDRAGLRCPRGAHIRRANPRDVLAVEDRGPEASVLMVRKHQMIRRGRPFGERVTAELVPRDLVDAARGKRAVPAGPRGLHFLCLVGDISRQFEFVQRAWIQSANFDSLLRDGDPIVAGRRPPGDPNPNDEFTCPADPVRKRHTQIPQFTTLLGGAYFFLPGIAALRFIAREPAKSE